MKTQRILHSVTCLSFGALSTLPTTAEEIPKEYYLLNSGARLISSSMTRTMVSDLDQRLADLRRGASGNHRNVWGTIYFLSEQFDEQTGVSGPPPMANIYTPRANLDIFGGTIGIDHPVNNNWIVGIALGAANGDADLRNVGNLDIDSFAIIPYVSYYQENALSQADFHFDLRYGYVDSDYSFTSLANNPMNFDGHSHLIEFNTGLDYQSNDITHGPFVQVRYLDGDAAANIQFESFATQLGYQVSRVIPANNGTFVPQIRVAWEHEFESDRGFLGTFKLGELDEDLFVGSLDLNFITEDGMRYGLTYQARLGSEAESHYLGLMGSIPF